MSLNTLRVYCRNAVHALAIALVLSQPAAAEDHPPAAVLADLHAWLNAETDLAPRSAAPAIHLISEAQAETLHGVADRSGGRLRGLYDGAARTIYLVEPWSADNLRDVSVLLHELVHHRQAEQHWYCPQAQEWDAYKIQEAWLGQHGIDSGFYWPAIVLLSSCTKRDIHPR